MVRNKAWCEILDDKIIYITLNAERMLNFLNYGLRRIIDDLLVTVWQVMLYELDIKVHFFINRLLWCQLDGAPPH